MARKMIAAGAVLFAGFASGCAYNPTVLGTTVPRAALCPSAGKYCAANIGNFETRSITRQPRYLVTLPDGSPDYWGFLGRKFTPTASPIVNYCGNVTTNPFSAYAAQSPTPIVVDSVANNTVEFNRKASTKTKLGSNADAAAIVAAAGLPTTIAEMPVEAAVKAALDRLNSTQVRMTGRYSYAYLDPSMLASLTANDRPPSLQACADAMAAGEEIIAAMTLVRVDTLTTTGELKSTASAGLDAALSGVLSSDQIAAVKAELEKKIEQDYKVNFSPTYQVLSIGGHRLT